MADIRTSGLYNRVSFTVVTSAGGSKTATLSNVFSAGVYTIQSIAGDTDLEIYLGAENGTNVGSSAAGSKAIVASADFKYVTTVNANTSDAIIFTLYQLASDATTLSTKTDAFWAPPVITDITPSSLYNQNATTVITGSNFASNAGVQFRKSDDATLVSAKSVTRTSETSITATRPDSFSTTDAPYDVVVTNSTTGLSSISLNAVTAGSAPSWATSTTLPAFQKTVAYSQSIVATDVDASPTVTYSVNSSTLPAGITFSAGTFSGTPTANTGSYSASIRATDLGGNFVDRTFTLAQDKPDAPTVGTATQTGSTTATLSFTAPTYTGTSTITTYTATSSPAGGTGSISQAGSGTITITGLTGSTAYTFIVTATNSSGISLASSASSSITTTAPSLPIELLVVSGGGSGGDWNTGGGGGAGGYRFNNSFTTALGSPLNLTVGAGGSPSGATKGVSSSFSTYSSTGGGRGYGDNSGASQTGGSGGGAGGNYSGGSANADQAFKPGNEGGYSPVEGFAGGTAKGSGPYPGGGGGGSSAVGNNWSGSVGGAGGAGTANSITGVSVTYAGGGGGGAYGVEGGSGGAGGSGGGGAGSGTKGANATANTGGGGGGSGGGTNNYGGGGGSGIVIIAYPNSYAAITSISGGLTYDQPTRSGYRVYRFTQGTGTVTF